MHAGVRDAEVPDQLVPNSRISIGTGAAHNSRRVAKIWERIRAIRASWCCGFRAYLALLFKPLHQADPSNPGPRLPDNGTSRRLTLYGNAAQTQSFPVNPHDGFTLFQDA